MKYNALLVEGLLAVTFSLGTLGASAPAAWVTSSDGVHKLSSYTPPSLGTGSSTSSSNSSSASGSAPGSAPGSASKRSPSRFMPRASSSTWKIEVDDTSSGHKQTVTGFGAAVTDATVSVFSALSDSQKSALLDDLFTTKSDDGVAFSLLRHTIGPSDLSGELYSYDNDTDSSLAKFDLTPAGTSMVSWISKFKSANPAIKLLGSLWSPPGWMKANGVMTGKTADNNLNPTYVDAFAQYFVQYIKAFDSGGASVDAITIQNEPLNSNAGYPTMYISADQSASLIQQNIGPALKSADLPTKIWAYDHNTDQPSYPQTVLDGAGSYVDTVAWHCYATNVDWSVLTQFQQKNPKVTQYMTECWTSPTNSWYSTIDFIMGPMQNWAAGVMAWTMATDTNEGPHLPGGCSTCRGLVTVDTSAGTYSKTLDYYFMGQFSRYVPRGAINLNTTGGADYGGGSKFEATSFLNSDGSRIVMLQNNFANSVDVTVKFNSGETWTGPVYQQSLTTWQLPPPGTSTGSSSATESDAATKPGVATT